MDCLFCRIIAGEIPARTIAESETALAFLDINPVSKGHALVIPRRHCADLFDASPEDLAGVAALAQRTASQLKAALACDGLNVSQHNGPAAGQEIFHYHVHLIPRWEGDGVLRGWQPLANPGNLDELAGRIRAAGGAA